MQARHNQYPGSESNWGSLVLCNSSITYSLHVAQMNSIYLDNSDCTDDVMDLKS